MAGTYGQMFINDAFNRTRTVPRDGKALNCLPSFYLRQSTYEALGCYSLELA